MTPVWTLFIVMVAFHQATCTMNQCTSQGKFPNDEDKSCVGYTMCLIAGAGNYMQLNISCPNGFIFHHVQSQCTNATNYQCQPEYNCTHVGNFSNPYSDDCMSYIVCVEGLNNIITARTSDCPDNHLFSPDEGLCVNETNVTCSSGYSIFISFYSILIYLLFISVL